MRACVGLSFLVVAALCGCDDDGTSSGDAAASDAAAGDADSVDAASESFVDAARPEDAGDVEGVDSGEIDPRDAGAPDVGSDVGSPDAGPPDPRFCPAGFADGCCSLSLRYGGGDPDCAPLDCETATLTEPIVLDEVPPSYAGTAAMSWTGRELRIAWTDPYASAGEGIWDERRSADGALLSGPTRRAVSLAVGSRFLVAGAALGYAPSTDRGLFVSLGTRALHAIEIDASDAPGWIGDLPPSCNGFHQPVTVYDTGTEWLVGHVEERCASPVDPTVTLTRVARDGTVGDSLGALARTRLGLTTAYDGANEVALVYSGPSPSANADLRARVVDVSAWSEGAETILVPASSNVSIDQAEAGHDGTTYGIVYDYLLYAPLGASRWITEFRTWSPGSEPSAPTMLFTSSDRRFAQGRVIGTADGWIVAMTTVLSTGTSLAPGATDDPEVWLYRLTPDGRVRQSLQIDADQRGALLPDLEWVGGRIALTWAREDLMRRQHHMLSFLGCE
ncbi:MAG: hypothetical protein J0L92_33345 [Deltaproteobacteria bacterium]|nr:hypothetical protein [Deltaproteobacteria bacterium]